MNWTKYLKEKYAPKAPTLASNLYDAAKQAAEELKEKYKWRNHTIAVTTSSVTLMYTTDSGLLMVSVPLKLVLRTLMVKPHLEKGIRKHIAQNLKKQKASKPDMENM